MIGQDLRWNNKEAKSYFFGLPAELSNSIYEMAFGYPRKLLVRTRGSQWPRMTVVDKDYQDPQHISQYCDSKTLSNTRAIKQILDPLSTCKQFYQEAMLPLIKIKTASYPHVYYKDEWTLPLPECNILVDALVTPCKSKLSSGFIFLTLPAELRNIIYEMVFSYPKQGLHVFKDSVKKTAISKIFNIYTHSYEKEFDLDVWATDRNTAPKTRELQPRPIQGTLAPLLTCRQFYDEKMGTFFRANHFYFKRLDVLCTFLRKIGPRRKKHLSHISITIILDPSTTALRGLRLLGDVDHLGKLSLRFFESAWIKTKAPGFLSSRVDAHDDISTLPALTELRRLKGMEEVKFCGPCPLLEQEL